jgi:hypothetical protein
VIFFVIAMKIDSDGKGITWVRRKTLFPLGWRMGNEWLHAQVMNSLKKTQIGA